MGDDLENDLSNGEELVLWRSREWHWRQREEHLQSRRGLEGVVQPEEGVMWGPEWRAARLWPEWEGLEGGAAVGPCV